MNSSDYGTKARIEERIIIVKKTATTIGFLNKKRTFIVLLAYAVFYSAICLIVTRKLNLASCLYSETMAGLFKEASRRLAWYVKTRFVYIVIADDNMFYFPISNNSIALMDQEDFLDRYKDRRSEIYYLADKIIIHAELLNTQINGNNNLPISQQSCQNYFQLISAYLKGLSNSDEYQKFRYSSAEEVVKFKENKSDFQQVGMECLLSFLELYPLTTYQWFVTGGTCLGLARHNHLIPHDFDVDVGVFYRSGLEVELEKIAQSSSCFETIKCDYVQLSCESGGKWENIKRPAFIKLVHKNGVNIDIFFHYKLGDKIVHGSSTVGWSNDTFKLKEGYIENLKVLHPDPIEHYLTEHYGDWDVVKKEFACSTDTYNMHVEKSFTGVAQAFKLLLPRMVSNSSDYELLFQQLKLAGLIFEENGRYQFNKSFFVKEN